MQAYRSLIQRFSRHASISDAIGLLRWDAETMMPIGAASSRSDQLAALRAVARELIAEPVVGELIHAAEADSGALDEWESANLREMRRSYRHMSAVPQRLVEAFSIATFRAQIAWRDARASSNFETMLRPLSEVLALQLEIGQAKGEALKLAPYDALLDENDPELRQSTIDPIFDELQAKLPPLIQEALAQQTRLPPISPPDGPFRIEAQQRLGKMMARAIGFDFDRGRIDESRHPLCGDTAHDVRITTHYDERNFVTGLTGLLHECGHALYEQARPAAREPAARARGTILHESQALLVEKQVCLTSEFVSFLAPLAKRAFHGTGAEWSVKSLHRILSVVKPGFIRVDADELTYPVHILIRYQLEKAIFGGDLNLVDLPGAFNEAIRRLLGLTVPSDRLGCLQDPHWAMGTWAYFPSYTLGALAAAQLFDAACRANADLLLHVSQGDFRPLREWLRTNIHSKGSMYSTEQILIAASGRSFDVKFFLDYLRKRYTDHR